MASIQQAVEQLREAAMKEWALWEGKLTELGAGTQQVTVTDLGPMELWEIHGGDQEAFVVTGEGSVLLLGEYMFKPTVSRYNIRRGCVLEITVEKVGKEIKSARVLSYGQAEEEEEDGAEL